MVLYGNTAVDRKGEPQALLSPTSLDFFKQAQSCSYHYQHWCQQTGWITAGESGKTRSKSICWHPSAAS